MPPGQDNQPDRRNEQPMLGLALVKAQMMTFPQLPRLWNKTSNLAGDRKFIPDVDGDPNTRISGTLEINLDLFEQLQSQSMPYEVNTALMGVVKAIQQLMTSSKPVELGVFLKSSDLSYLIHKLDLLEDVLKKY